MKAPDFVGVGVPKAGTSWWFQCLIEHPEVAAPIGYDADDNFVGKQLHYFDRFHHDPWVGQASIESYHNHFPGGDRLTGEWTPRYSQSWWTMPLLGLAAPRAKILMILRNPVDRYESWISHIVKHETRDRGLLVESDGFHPFAAVWSEEAWWQGLYGPQVHNVLRVYPRDQVLILQYEQIIRDPYRFLGRTFRFLGLDGIAPPSMTETLNASGHSYRLNQAQRDSLKQSYYRDWAELGRLVPDEIDTSLWT